MIICFRWAKQAQDSKMCMLRQKAYCPSRTHTARPSTPERNGDVRLSEEAYSHYKYEKMLSWKWSTASLWSKKKDIIQLSTSTQAWSTLSEDWTVTSKWSSTKYAMSAILRINLSRRFGTRRTKASLGDVALDEQKHLSAISARIIHLLQNCHLM